MQLLSSEKPVYRSVRKRSALYLVVTFALAACGGGGGGGGNDNGGGGSGGGGGGPVAVNRPNCSKPPSGLQSSVNPKYGFLFPTLNSSAQITLVDADNFKNTPAVTPHGKVVPGSIAVAQTATFTPAAGGAFAQIKNLAPSRYVYVAQDDRRIYQIDLRSSQSHTPVPVLPNLSIPKVCNASSVTYQLSQPGKTYYLYSTPGAGGKCSNSASDDAHLVSFDGSVNKPAPNARPIDALYDPQTDLLQGILALDRDPVSGNANLQFYDRNYDPGTLITGLSTFTRLNGLYHSLDTAFVGVVNDNNPSNDRILRVQETGNGTAAQTVFQAGGQLTAAAADTKHLYYAVSTGSGYTVYSIFLGQQTPSPTKVTTRAAGSAVANLGVTTDGHVIVLTTNNTGTNTGTLYSVDADTGATLKLDGQVSLANDRPVVTAYNNIYYTVDTGAELMAKRKTVNGNNVGDSPYRRSSWFYAALPRDRSAGVNQPTRVLLAAGYAPKAYPSLIGSVLDSFPTQSNPNTPCYQLTGQIGGQIAVIPPTFSTLVPGVAAARNERDFFALDLFDGRFTGVPH